MSEEFYGPTFEEAEESIVFPMGEYIINVEGWDFKSTKNPAEDGSYGYAITPHLKVLSAPDDKFTGKVLRPWWAFSGWSCFVIPRACQQAGLDDIDKIYNVKHPDYKPEAERPVFTGSEEDNYKKVATHYMTGEMTDDNGKVWKCEDGGLEGQRLKVNVGKPNTKDPKAPKTGNVIPAKI